jgi:hypothetical protein
MARVVKEKWKPIIGYEGYYEVSNHGRVRGLPRITSSNRPVLGRDKKASFQGRGYLSAWLSKEGNESNCLIHRLVATAFLSNKSNLPEVNHKNGIKTDNGVWNLEWCTKSYNIKHGFAMGLMVSKKGSKHPLSKLREKDVLEIRSMKKVSNREISEIFGVSYTNIWMIKNRKIWKHI